MQDSSLSWPERCVMGDGIRAVREHDMFNVLDTSTGWKIDLIVRKDRAFSVEEFARRTPVTIDGIDTYVASPEDSILSKLEWAKESGSEVQLRDVAQMISAFAKSLDWVYLRSWASDLGISG